MLIWLNRSDANSDLISILENLHAEIEEIVQQVSDLFPHCNHIIN